MNNNIAASNPNAFNQSPSAEKPQKRKKIIVPIIIISVLLVLAALVTTFFIFRSKHTAKPPVCEGTIVESQRLNSFEKIQMDYSKGEIDVNTYFTQLFYSQYDCKKLDKKYISDTNTFTSSENNKLAEVLLQHRDEIDEEIIKAYANKINLSDVDIVYREDNINLNSKAVKASNYTVKPLANTDETQTATEPDKSLITNHELDKVLLSRNDNFLIWYTETGEDGISQEQAQSIANGLEDTIGRYNELFGLSFDYSPTLEMSLGSDYKDAASVLKANNISENLLKTAMNVYIFDTGDNNVAATHTKLDNNDLTHFIATFIEDGFTAYPYIQINRRAFSDEERLAQLYNHELFHAYQDIYARSIINEIVEVPENYLEAMANLASSYAHEYDTTNSFLNEWAGVYFSNPNTPLQELTDGASLGYGAFPYFYIYSQEVEDWVDNLMYAHLTDSPYDYLQDATDKEELKAVADKVSYYILANDFDNNALHSNTPVSTKAFLDKASSEKDTVNPGSFVVYEIGKNMDLEVNLVESDYGVINLYGYKNGRFTEIGEGAESLKADTAAYPRYEQFFLTINNASLTMANSYSVKTASSDLAPNVEFDTTFDNYKVNIEMDVTVAGFTTKTLSTGVIDEIHQKEYLETTINTGDVITLTSYSYYDFYSGNVYMTQVLDNDKWYMEESQSQHIDLGIILDKLNNSKDTEEIDSNHYRVKLSKRDAKGVLSHSDTDVPVIVGSVYVDVYTDNGYITKLDFDFSKALVKMIGDIKVSMTFSDYNTAGDVRIPQEIINSATDEIVSVPSDLESMGEYIQDNPSFLDTIQNIFGL